MSRILRPLLAGALGLLGALAASLWLFHAAHVGFEHAQDERLAGVGEAAAVLFGAAAPTPALLRALMQANALDGAYVVDVDRTVVADASNAGPRKLDLLRTDVRRLQRALAGEATVESGFTLGTLSVRTGQWPIRSPDGAVRGVLILEAGRQFGPEREQLVRARNVGLGLGAVSGLALALLAVVAARSERGQRRALERAVRGETLRQMAAVAAHEVRNPLGVIRGTVELMRERLGPRLDTREAEALGDILGEVERLKQLTEELLELSADRPLQLSQIDLEALLREAGRATEAAHPGVRVDFPALSCQPVEADRDRLWQVFRNLLLNAAQAQESGAVVVTVLEESGWTRVRVHDEGPGVALEVQERLFEPFVTGKRGGTGLGLAVSRRLVERHGGTLRWIRAEHGTTFEVSLRTPRHT